MRVARGRAMGIRNTHRPQTVLCCLLGLSAGGHMVQEQRLANLLTDAHDWGSRRQRVLEHHGDLPTPQR